ncbi:MAG: 4Fe-4S dicluster domain-containing protein, partial [Candidatus Hydrogenedentota bacterium]
LSLSGRSTGFALCDLAFSVGSIFAGALLYGTRHHLRRPAGIQNNGMMSGSVTARGAAGWILGVALTAGYIVLYWYPAKLSGPIRMHDPLSHFLRGRPADQWFLYGTLYTVAILAMGAKAIARYRHSRYQVIRTLAIMIAQLFFAYLIPSVLQLFHEPEYYFSYFWPLKYDYLFPSTLHGLRSHPGRLGAFMAWWGILISFVAVPVLTYFFGKRWYCSWVCGCGGLANTAGDSFRQLSSKKLAAWRLERWSIHLVLVFITLTTAMLWANSYQQGKLLGEWSVTFSKWYGFYIGALWSGVIGVGFYPILGTRVWCRFGCPQAAILGILQRFFSRFRITTNGGQCISCGNCSTYCEMGIDVRWYAQRGRNIVRASCVGCGMCATVCPRGVLNLENGPVAGRIDRG